MRAPPRRDPAARDRVASRAQGGAPWLAGSKGMRPARCGGSRTHDRASPTGSDRSAVAVVQRVPARGIGAALPAGSHHLSVLPEACAAQSQRRPKSPPGMPCRMGGLRSRRRVGTRTAGKFPHPRCRSGRCGSRRGGGCRCGCRRDFARRGAGL
jgi:hypothetical protein